MKHYIIVKYNDSAEDKALICNEISRLFEKSTLISGINSVSVNASVIDLPNRYDLMIIIDMDKDALQGFDSSELHFLWKKNFSKYIESKVIFDCD